VAGALLVSLACTSGGSGGEPGDGSSGEGASAVADADRLEVEIVRLLADHDAVVNQIIADPSVTETGDHPLVAEYLDLFEPDSEFAGQALETWRTSAADAVAIRPYDDAHPANLTRLDGDVEVVSDDEVRIPTCSELRQLVYEGDRLVEGLPYVAQPGESVAVLVDGDWVLRRRDVFVDVPECATDNPDAPDIPRRPEGAGTTETTDDPADTGSES
jgi:hypothetical protein